VCFSAPVLPGFPFGPYGRGQAVDQHRSGTFAWVTKLLHGPPGRPMTPNGPPFSPNYVHIADVARAHVAALRVGPLDPPRRKRILLVAGYVLWHEVIVHLAEAMPEVRERLPSPTCGTGRRPAEYAQFEARNAREILGIDEYKSWQEAIEDAVKDMLRVESRMPGSPV
jgi:nucleoside-diphosphate-sugar epimerase